MKILTDIFSFRATENLAGLASATISTAFSPTWWLLKSLLSPYLKIDLLTNNSLSMESLPQIILSLSEQMNALSAEVLLSRILPILLLCLAVSCLYMFTTAWLGQKAFRLLVNFVKSKSRARPASMGNPLKS